MSATSPLPEERLAPEHHLLFMGAFARGLVAGGCGILWSFTDGARLWFVDEYAQRESPRIHRANLITAALLGDALAELVAIRDAWPPMAEYNDLPDGFNGPLFGTPTEPPR